MAKMGRDGPAPDRLRVDVWTNRKRDPELVEWLWRNPRSGAKKIRELLRAYLASESDAANGPSDAVADLKSASQALVRPARPQTAAQSPVDTGRAGISNPAHPPPSRSRTHESQPVGSRDGHDDQARAPAAQAKAVEAPASPERQATAVAPDTKAAPRQEWPPPPPPPANELPTQPATQRAEQTAPPTRRPPPPTAPAQPPDRDVQLKPEPKGENHVTLTPEAIKAREALFKLVRSAPKPSQQ